MSFPYYLFFLLLSPLTVANVFFSQICEPNGGNYTSNSTFQSHLHLLLTSLTSSTSTFTTVAKGTPPNRAFLLSQCRNDVTLSDCTLCLHNASQHILRLCPHFKKAIIWYENCQLRYSDSRFFATVSNDIGNLWSNYNNATDPDGVFNDAVTELVEKISYQAAYNASSLMFATGKMVYRWDSPAVYGMVQCTRDVPADGCSQCLHDIFLASKGPFEGKQGGQTLAYSCNFRYELYSFYRGEPSISLTVPPPATDSPPPPATDFSPPLASDSPQTEEGNKSSSTGTAVLKIGIPLGIGLVLVLITVSTIWLSHRRRRSAKKNEGNQTGAGNQTGSNYNFNHSGMEGISGGESLFFDLSILKVATANFSAENKLGSGGFGTVYKGTLSDGQEIALKRLSKSSSQGLEHLTNELVLLAKLQHKNLVRLRGVCLEEEEKLLVYEYLPNRSLDTILFDPVRAKQLDWKRRSIIIRGIARGLQYLHEESHIRVIHRDLKASNVLLDADMNPRISDFGLARLFGENESQVITSRIAGTFGYMSPEYIMRGQFSTKLDVFSFGILVLEIVSGRKNSYASNSKHGRDLLGYAWDLWIDGTISEIVDPSLGQHFPSSEVWRCIQIALLCAQEDQARRPHMSSVVLMLNSFSMTVPAPVQPAFLVGMTTKDSNV